MLSACLERSRRLAAKVEGGPTPLQNLVKKYRLPAALTFFNSRSFVLRKFFRFIVSFLILQYGFYYSRIEQWDYYDGGKGKMLKTAALASLSIVESFKPDIKWDEEQMVGAQSNLMLPKFCTIVSGFCIRAIELCRALPHVDGGILDLIQRECVISNSPSTSVRVGSTSRLRCWFATCLFVDLVD